MTASTIRSFSCPAWCDGSGHEDAPATVIHVHVTAMTLGKARELAARLWSHLEHGDKFALVIRETEEAR